MNAFEVVIAVIIIPGLLYMVYIIWNVPVYLLKNMLRNFRGADWEISLATFPIWGIAWIIDKLFKLDIFIMEFEVASKPINIISEQYDRFLTIGTINTLQEKDAIVKSFDIKHEK